MHIPSTSSTPLKRAPLQGWSREECTEEKVHALLVEIFVSLVQDGQTRASAYQKKPQVLNQGYWYANDYCEALQKCKEQRRLSFFRQRNKFHHGHPPKRFVHNVDARSLTGKRLCGYTMRKGVQPTVALESCQKDLCFIDCQELIEIAYYKALHTILGTKTFNNYFSKHPLVLDPNLLKTPLYSLTSTISLNDASQLRLGDGVYFTNLPFYSIKHPHGEGMGYHTLCIKTGNEQAFTAFGLDPKGLTKDDIVEVLLSEFNQPPLEGTTILTADLAEQVAQSYHNTVSTEMLDIAPTFEITKEELVKTYKENGKPDGIVPSIRRMNIVVLRHLLPPPSGWKQQELTAIRVNTLFVQIFSSLVSARKDALSGGLRELDRGSWYATDYFDALQKHKQEERLAYFRTLQKFYHGHPPKGFRHDWDSTTLTRKSLYGYTMKKEIKPSVALEACHSSVCFFDCQEMVELAYYETLLQILGLQKFNSYFRSHPLKLNPDLQKTPLVPFLACTPLSATTLQVGDAVHFLNFSFYEVKHPCGAGGGYHAICTKEGDNPKFTAFGLHLGMTEDSMITTLVNEYNKRPLNLVKAFKPSFIAKILQKRRTKTPKEVLQSSRIFKATEKHFRLMQKADPTQIGMYPAVVRIKSAFLRSFLST